MRISLSSIFAIMALGTLLLLAVTPTFGHAATDYNSYMGSPSNSNDLNSLMGGSSGQKDQLSSWANDSSQVSYTITDEGVQGYLIAFGYFINGTLIPSIFALGLLFFLYNTARYFIIKSGDPTTREQARKQALYGVLAFVFLVSVWGIVNMFIYGLDLYDDVPVGSDYVENSSNYGSGSWLNSLMGGSGNNSNQDPNSKMGPSNNPFTDFLSI